MRANRFKKTLISVDGVEIKAVKPQIRYIPLEDSERISPPDISTGLAWYAVVVRPGTHRRVMVAMARAGIAAYLPVETIWSRRPRSNVREELQRPLLGSILFIGADASTSWMAVRFNDDITGVLSNYGIPLPIPVGDLRALAARERAGEFQAAKLDPAAPEALADTHDAVGRTGIQLGDVAALNEGPFVGAEVDVVGIQGEEARVVLRHFRSATIMRVPTSMLSEMPQPEVIV